MKREDTAALQAIARNTELIAELLGKIAKIAETLQDLADMATARQKQPKLHV